MPLKDTFAQEVTQEEDQINLARAALLISTYLNQTFDARRYLALLDDMAESARPAVLAAPDDREIIEALNHYLFEELKFQGNVQDYYNPVNSFLNQVLDSKRGIPISLSAVYMETGWRLKLPLWGVGLPWHFVVGYGPPASPIYIDVFNQGKILSEQDCLSLARVPSARYSSFKQQFLKPVAKTAILYRMLLNLKHIYIRLEDWDAAYKTVDLMLVVRPDMSHEYRDRGLLAYRLKRLQEAMFDLKHYLFLVPNSPDEAQLKQQIETIEQELLRLN
jgi:regulator of sirC expression with transglutaminase-like and TPR domain